MPLRDREEATTPAGRAEGHAAGRRADPAHKAHRNSARTAVDSQHDGLNAPRRMGLSALRGWNMTLATDSHFDVRDAREKCAAGVRDPAFSCGRANELTLSCKNRPPCWTHRGTVAAATERASEGAKCGRRDAVQFGAARGGSAAGPTVRRFLSACEGC